MAEDHHEGRQPGAERKFAGRAKLEWEPGDDFRALLNFDGWKGVMQAETTMSVERPCSYDSTLLVACWISGMEILVFMLWPALDLVNRT